VAGEKPARPQLVGRAEVVRPLARGSRPRAIIQPALGHGAGPRPSDRMTKPQFVLVLRHQGVEYGIAGIAGVVMLRPLHRLGPSPQTSAGTRSTDVLTTAKTGGSRPGARRCPLALMMATRGKPRRAVGRCLARAEGMSRPSAAYRRNPFKSATTAVPQRLNGRFKALHRFLLSKG
jgi:hypothetical protein